MFVYNFRYVTSFPVDGDRLEPTSLPISKSVGNIAEPNVVRLHSKQQEKDEKSQVNRKTSVTTKQ